MYSAVPPVSADPDVRLGWARAPGGEGVLRPGQGPGAAGDQQELTFIKWNTGQHVYCLHCISYRVGRGAGSAAAGWASGG